MAETLKVQKQDLERALQQDDLTTVVREALKAQLKSVTKKINGKTRRTATLPDGTITGGSEVIRVYPGCVDDPRYTTRKIGMRLPKIGKVTICAISPDGKAACFGDNYRGRHNFYDIEKLFCTNKGALKWIIADAEDDLAQGERDLAKYEERVGILKEYVKEVKALKADALPTEFSYSEKND